MTYARDYVGGTGFIDAMKARNLVSFPIEKVTYRERNGSHHILSGVLNKYSTLNPERIEEIFTIENDEPITLSQFKFSNRSAGVLPLTGTPSGFLPADEYVRKIRFYGNWLQKARVSA